MITIRDKLNNNFIAVKKDIKYGTITAEGKSTEEAIRNLEIEENKQINY